MRDEIRAAIGCAPEISTRPKHFNATPSTTSTPRISGPCGLSGGSGTSTTTNGRGTSLTPAPTSPGIYRYNNGNGKYLGGNKENPPSNKQYIGDVRNGLSSHGIV